MGCQSQAILKLNFQPNIILYFHRQFNLASLQRFNRIILIGLHAVDLNFCQILIAAEISLLKPKDLKLILEISLIDWNLLNFYLLVLLEWAIS